ncbi:MAG: radical SAM protein [Candidatus Omnitrophota bacterium]
MRKRSKEVFRNLSRLKIRFLSLIPRILKDIIVRLKKPSEAIRYVEMMKEDAFDYSYFAPLMKFDLSMKKKHGYFLGHFDELHDRVSGKAGSFDSLLQEKSDEFKKNHHARIEIGITRYNFFCISESVAFILKEIIGSNAKFAGIDFNIFPVDKIISNFGMYLKELKKRVQGLNIELVLCDPDLFNILEIIQVHAKREKISHRELVRLLGIISEHAFIGPQTIVFDPFHRCNIKCKHCFVHNPLIHHPQEFLDRQFNYETFKSIIDDAADLLVDGIILQGDGEPLLYDKFFDMLRYARSKDIGVLFFTNGSLIGLEQAREIVDLGIREIYCSFPAGTAKTYSVVTSSNQDDIFYTIVRNLKRLVEIKKEKNKSQPRLVMTHVIHHLNFNELIDMAKTDAQIGTDAARFYLIRLDDNNKHLKLTESELKIIKKDLPVAASIFRKSNIDFVDNINFQLRHYDGVSGAWSKDIFLKEGCSIGWYFCLIPALYDVSMCCHLRTVGYLNKQSFKELWNSREYRRFRIKAKFLNDNRDFVFLNGVRLYDEHCEHCDNHQTLLTNLDNLRKLGLYQFIK